MLRFGGSGRRARAFAREFVPGWSCSRRETPRAVGVLTRSIGSASGTPRERRATRVGPDRCYSRASYSKRTRSSRPPRFAGFSSDAVRSRSFRGHPSTSLRRSTSARIRTRQICRRSRKPPRAMSASSASAWCVVVEARIPVDHQAWRRRTSPRGPRDTCQAHMQRSTAEALDADVSCTEPTVSCPHAGTGGRRRSQIVSRRELGPKSERVAEGTRGGFSADHHERAGPALLAQSRVSTLSHTAHEVRGGHELGAEV